MSQHSSTLRHRFHSTNAFTHHPTEEERKQSKFLKLKKNEHNVKAEGPQSLSSKQGPVAQVLLVIIKCELCDSNDSHYKTEQKDRARWKSWEKEALASMWS